MHLLLPLIASFVFVASLIGVKRVAKPSAAKTGVGPVTVLFFSNLAMALAFTFFWPIGGTPGEWTLLWQPLALAVFFILGLLFTFAAVRRGDLSVATPVFGIKIVIVAVLVSTIGSQELSVSIWLAAFMAASGIALIQWTGRHEPKNVLLTIVLAILASTFYAHFDVLTQGWAPEWGSGRILAITFWFVGLLSLPMIPWVEWSQLRDPEIRFWLSVTAILTMLQAFLMVLALAYFGDAPRINIIFALRGMWALVLAWILRRKVGSSEAMLPRGAFRTRFIGAALLTLAVVLAIAFPG
jgi:drug/metabolite transporter (DMT)-like permease